MAMVRHVISCSLTAMICCSIYLMPDYKTAIITLIILLSLFTIINILLDKRDHMK